MSEHKKSRQEEYAEQIAQELIERLQKGTAPFQVPWNPSMGRDFPYNPVSGVEYSGLNTLRLMLQGRDDPRWLTYKQAASINAQVRKGERGVGLVRLITHSERVKKDENGKTVRDENGQPVKELQSLEQPFFKGFTVFNAEQIDGLPELKQTEPVWENHERAEKLLAVSGAAIKHGGNDAYYNPRTDQIVLPKKEQFNGQGEYYAVALHELGHWTGHESRLNRDLRGRYGSETYAREELRAEIASLMLTRELGLPHNPDRHAHYVGSWVKVLSEEPMEILKATQDAGRIKSFVLGFEQQIEMEQKAERPSGTVKNELDKPMTSGEVTQQNLFERFQTAKLEFDKRLANGSESDRKIGHLMEAGMEALIKGLPEQTQLQARTNFYETQLNRFNEKKELAQPPEQQELFTER